MTFEFPPLNDTDGCTDNPENSPFSEEEWDVIEALAEPGAIF